MTSGASLPPLLMESLIIQHPSTDSSLFVEFCLFICAEYDFGVASESK